MGLTFVDVLFIATYAVGATFLFVAELIYAPRWHRSILMWVGAFALGAAFEFWRRDLDPATGFFMGGMVALVFSGGLHLRQWWYGKIIDDEIKR